MFSILITASMQIRLSKEHADNLEQVLNKLKAVTVPAAQQIAS